MFAIADAARVGVGPTETAQRNIVGADQLEVYISGGTSKGHLQ
jgi:hypothetical protein